MFDFSTFRLFDVLTFVVVACCWLGGCAAPPNRGKTAPDTQTGATGESAGLCEGRPVEVLEEHWEDGNPKVQEEVVMGDDGEYIRHGVTTHWWPNGTMKLQLSFDCGVRNGDKNTWWPNGKPWSTGGFVDGRDHGTWTVWHENGLKAREFTLDHGAWNGPFTVWHPNGRKKLEIQFVNGLQQGSLTVWDSQGNVVRRAEYADGEEQPLP